MYEDEKEQTAKVCWDDSICACALKRGNAVIDNRIEITKLFMFSNEMLEVVDRGE